MDKIALKWKIAIGLLVVLLLVAVVLIVKLQKDVADRQEAIEKSVVEMKQLQDGWVRSSAKYATKDDVEKFAKDKGVNLDPIKKDIEALRAELKGISVTSVKTPGYSGTNLPSTSTQPNPEKNPTLPKCPDGSVCPDPYGYQKNTQVLKLNEPFSDKSNVPWGEVKFSAWKEKPWDLNIKPREYSVVTVLSTDEENRHFVHNKFTIKTDGKKYDIPVEKSEFVEVYPDNKFRFDLHLLLGMDAGIYLNSPLRGDVVPNAELSFFSYGKTKTNPEFIFLGVGPGYAISEKRFNVVLTPVMYNLGEPLPLVQNLYIGPSLSLDTSGNVGVLGGVHVGL